jgi:hypothetical protein
MDTRCEAKRRVVAMNPEFVLSKRRDGRARLMAEGLPTGFPMARRYAANADQSMERRRGQDAISNDRGSRGVRVT